MQNSLKLAAVLVAVTAVSASAQGRGRNTDGVPPGQRPPAGMCRVWINGVPPGQQPGVTDCATARANLPANARILYGARTRGRGTAASNTFLRRRQLSDGSWVTDRLRRDANGNLVVLSSRPFNPNAVRNGDDDENGSVRGERDGNDDERGDRHGDKGKRGKGKDKHGDHEDNGDIY